MTLQMFVAWVAFPLVLLAVCLGCGLLVERIAGWRLPGTLLPSVGLSLVIVAATLSTGNATTAPLSTAAIILLALGGYASGWRHLRAVRLEPWTLAVGLGVFAVCAMPVVFSGSATFLGYFVDNDTAFHFALIDQLMSHGHSLRGLTPSAFSSALQNYLSTGYPVGADMAVGVIRPIVGQDIAWIFQPYLAFILALGGVALFELLREVVKSPALRALCAFIAAQSGLVFAYYLEDSVKELATSMIITVTVALVFVTLRQRLGPRALAPLIVVAVAGFDVVNVAIVPWLGLPLALFLLIAARRARSQLRRMSRPRLIAGSAATIVILAAVVALVAGSASAFFNTATGVLASGNALGNLHAPLQRWQILGIWPSGDFRFPVENNYRLAYALIGVAIAAAGLGLAWMHRRRAFPVLLLLLGDAIATVYLLSRGTPYADAKTMMICSVAVLLTAMLGAAGLRDMGRAFESWALAAVLAVGVLWTNALAYRRESIAPRGRFVELAAIGSHFARGGPTFYNQSDEFAIHFLRQAAPVVPHTWGPLPVSGPGVPARNPDQTRLPWDINDLAPGYVQSFRLLVLGRSPLASRPPADFKLVYQGRYYDVWQRTPGPQVLEHVPLGVGLHNNGVARCSLVRKLASRAAHEGARLAYSGAPQGPALVPTEKTQAPGWGPVNGNPYALTPAPQEGPITGSLAVSQPGRYDVWMAAALSRRVTVWVGRRLIGSTSYQLGPPGGQFIRIGEVSLPAGTYAVRIAPSGSKLAPGQTTIGEVLGPLVLVRDPPASTFAELPPSGAGALCGRVLNWLEIVH